MHPGFWHIAASRFRSASALASLERLNEIAESMMRRLDELLMPPLASLRERAADRTERSVFGLWMITHARSEIEVAPERRYWVTGLGVAPRASRAVGRVAQAFGCSASKVNVEIADSTYLPADAALKNLEEAGDNLLLVVAAEHRR